MASWKSIAKMVFSLERYLPGNYGYSEYLDVTYTWEYGTTADYLSITEKDKQSSETHSYGKYEAEAELKVLANWYSCFEGKYALKKLLKEELEED